MEITSAVIHLSSDSGANNPFAIVRVFLYPGKGICQGLQKFLGMTPVLRVGRPTIRLSEVVSFYKEGLGFTLLSSFENHAGFDGAILGHPHAPWHLEFTHHRGITVGNAPTLDHLLVLYLPERDAWEAACARIEAFGAMPVPSYNPWWDARGRTYEDPDGYRIVLENAEWTR